MSVVKQRNPDGSYRTIHRRAVLQTEEYRGWEVRVHWGGIEGRKIINGPHVTEFLPKKSVWHRLDRKDLKPFPHRPQEIEIKTTCEPFVYGNRPFNLAMVKRVKNAIDAWEENAEKKYGIR